MRPFILQAGSKLKNDTQLVLPDTCVVIDEGASRPRLPCLTGLVLTGGSHD